MVSLSIRGRNIKFDNDDGYMTPKHVWEDITAHIPKDKIIYEPFFGDGASGRYLKELGCMTVIHEKIDFFSHQFKYDLIISNPPYSCKKKIFEKLIQDDKPFILLVPISTLSKQYFKPIADKCSVIIPKKRIQFLKAGQELNRCWFDVIYICYKINSLREREIIYL